MVSNPNQHEADQDRVLAHLSRQRTGLMGYTVRKLSMFLIALGTSLKQFGQEVRSKHVPSKQRLPWSQSPHH